MVAVAVTIWLHVAVLLPIAGSRPGDHPLLDTGTDFVGAVCVAAMLWLRARQELTEPEDSAAGPDAPAFVAGPTAPSGPVRPATR